MARTRRKKENKDYLTLGDEAGHGGADEHWRGLPLDALLLAMYSI